jgi:hypothetical protein
MKPVFLDASGLIAELGIVAAFTVDRHFSQAGFQRLIPQDFEHA